MFVCFVFSFAARRILVPQPGIELAPPAVEAWSLNHWTAREIPKDEVLKQGSVGTEAGRALEEGRRRAVGSISCLLSPLTAGGRSGTGDWEGSAPPQAPPPGCTGLIPASHPGPTAQPSHPSPWPGSRAQGLWLHRAHGPPLGEPA